MERPPCHVFDGKAIASQILLEIKHKLEGFVDKPCLAVVSVGSRKDADSFVRSKLREAQVCGVEVVVKRFDKNIGEQELLEQVRRLFLFFFFFLLIGSSGKVALLNANPAIDGIVLQLPLPSHLLELTICQAVDNEKVSCAFGGRSSHLCAKRSTTTREHLLIWRDDFTVISFCFGKFKSLIFAFLRTSTRFTSKTWVSRGETNCLFLFVMISISL